MIFTSSFTSTYDCESLYYRLPSQQGSSSVDNQKKYLQQLRAVEEAKRRMDAERYQGMQAARQDYISRLEEAEVSREAYETAKRRREMEEAKQDLGVLDLLKQRKRKRTP